MGTLPEDDEWRSTLDVKNYFVEPTAIMDVFKSNGFALLQNAVSEAGCRHVRECCMQIAREMLAIDGKKHGNRGEGRYSIGAASASGQQLHHREWANLLSDPVLDALDSIYGAGGYLLRGGGGEIVLGGVGEYQDLHADVSRQPPSCDTLERPPITVVNFAVHPIAEDHGPTRIWPARGRPRDLERPLRLEQEPRDVKRSTLAPLPSGSCVVRDARIWHGGTPNRRTYARYLPNLEFFSREYAGNIALDGGGRFQRRTMTQEVFAALSPRARLVCEDLVSYTGVPQGIKPGFVRPQGRVFREGIRLELAKTQAGGRPFVFSGNAFECRIVMDLAKDQGLDSEFQRQGLRRMSTVTVCRRL